MEAKYFPVNSSNVCISKIQICPFSTVISDCTNNFKFPTILLELTQHCRGCRESSNTSDHDCRYRKSDAVLCSQSCTWKTLFNCSRSLASIALCSSGRPINESVMRSVDQTLSDMVDEEFPDPKGSWDVNKNNCY